MGGLASHKNRFISEFLARGLAINPIRRDRGTGSDAISSPNRLFRRLAVGTFLGFNSAECLIRCELQLIKFILGEYSDSCLECRFWNGSQLENKGDGIFGQALFGGRNQRGSRQVGSFEIGCERNDENGLKNIG